jgi:nucleotide-binding universal stress UspA family protein
MKRILVPTDFSEQSENALALACQLAVRMDAEIELLHVLDSPDGDQSSDLDSIIAGGGISGGSDINAIFFVKLVEKTRERLNEIISRPDMMGLQIIHRMKMGTPYKVISNETENGKVDLIIMGTSGTSNWEEAFVGSNAERVVRHAFCPVFTVRNKVDVFSINNIAYASDFKHNHKHLVEILKEMAKFLSAQIHLVKINTPGGFQNDKINYAALKSFAEENKFSNYECHVYNFEDEEDGIISFAESNDMNMIVLATEGRTGFARLLEGSITEDVVNYSKIPVLTFRTGNA